MILGIAQVDITPKPGVELSGFAARTQPSIGVLDPLFARGLFLVGTDIRLLWIHCDLIGFERALVLEFRRWAGQELGLLPQQVMLSATHTHSGPSTIHLQESGAYDPVYVEFLRAALQRVAHEATQHPEPVEVAIVEGRLDLAVDRRKTASSQTDPRLCAVGFRRPDGTFAAAVLNYPIHPVALGHVNRLISADISGHAAVALAQQLPGHPVVLATNGACGNLNPPAEGVDPAQVRKWGEAIANVIAQPLKIQPTIRQPPLALGARTVELPLEILDADGINAFADKALGNPEPLAHWGDKYRRAVEHWRAALLANSNRPACHEAELFALRLADLTLVGANAEVFSEFTTRLRRHGRKVYLIGYANGNLGYLLSRAAYAEGGYEVEMAHLFYGGFRPRAGSLELLAAEAVELIASL